ncbi:MAG: LytTR family transcriptional regulator DNA-binding domain-containing protein [Lachnospiraceae bacterium]|nr:LytTR family transcriptional regulator DNA-binding domain-containing protein [Lachnospiraceae bacterium]MBR5677502.1 LytTR family transcriptional regulator DNA-binding domain-containing protein [Paludibacteraceae bacterium]
MKISAEIKEQFKELEVHVCNDELNDEVKSVMGRLHTLFDSYLSATDEAGNKCMIHPMDVYSFYSEGQKVFVLDKDKKYVVQRKLFELEKEFESLSFVRISKSEIVNYKKIRSLDMSLSGTIRVVMKNGYETYTSRRNVSKIKQLLLKDKK